MERRKHATRPRRQRQVLLALLAAVVLLLAVAIPAFAGRDYYEVLGVPRDAHDRRFCLLLLLSPVSSSCDIIRLSLDWSGVFWCQG